MSIRHPIACAMLCFNQLNKMQAITLVREVQGAHYQQENTEATERPTFCGQIPLDDSQIDDIMSFFIKQQLRVEQCSIVISAQSLTEAQAEISPQYFTAPNVVNLMLKQIDCAIVIEC